MNQPTPEKDNFVLYLSLATIALVGVLLAVKLNENQKFAPIKQQLEEENKQMNIRVIRERED
jgi:energy-converting hydrogenase Eha subunit F